jgi:GT2 family glycosyltransferase
MYSGPMPILVKTWSEAGSHRYRYIETSLPSLLASELPASVHIIIVDDQSSDRRLTHLLERLAADSRVELWRNPSRMGPNLGQEYNFPRVVERFADAQLFLLCDDDIVYHPKWLTRLLRVYSEARAAGLTGIFSAFNVPFRPAFAQQQLPTSDVLLKERQAASNWLLPRDIYDSVGPFKDAGIAYDTEYCNRLAQHGIPVVCLKPSYVQNIGYVGAYQTNADYTAKDFVGALPLWVHLREAGYRVYKHAASLLRLLGR